MNDRHVKVGPNRSNTLTDEEWREYVLFYRTFESLEHYEKNLKQHKEMKAAMSEYYQRELTERKPLCDKIWRH